MVAHSRSLRQKPVATRRSGIGRSLSVVDRPVTDLRPDPNNPRVRSRKQIRQIARSIETFGFNLPVLIDAQGRLIAGHGRVLAAQLLRMTHVPTIELDHLSEAQLRAFTIADNRLTENSIWNEKLLAEQLKQLSALELDFNLEVIGFEVAEIDLMIAAERTGRTCFGIELSPVYVDTTISRWETFTGQHAVNESSGRAFNEIEQEMTNG